MKVMNNWHRSQRPTDPSMVGYQAPEEMDQLICGEVDGEQRSILLERIKGRVGDVLISLSDNEYKLGDPKPDYEAQYPNCKQRLLDSFPEIQR